MDQPKIERMLRLMQLLASNVDYTIDELARKLDTSYRSIYRYIDTFKDSGFVVEKLYGNVYKMTTMPKSYPNFDKLLYFSEEEAVLVNSLLDRLDPTNALKTDLKKKLAVIYNTTSIADFVDKRSNAVNVEALGKAVKGKRKAVLRNYESGNSHTVRDRIVEPFAFTTNFIDVWAFDLEDNRVKTFKISRIETVEICEEEWTNEEGHIQNGMDIFRMTGYEGKTITMEMSMYAKDLLLEEYPLAEKQIHKSGDKWILQTEVFNFAGACRFYTGLAGQIRIVESNEFRNYVKEYVGRNLSDL